MNNSLYNRLLQTTRRWGIAIGGITGVLLIVLGAIFSSSTWAGSLALAVGGALIAAAALAYLALPRDEFVERMWDLGLVNAFLNRAKDTTDEDWVRLVRKTRHYYKVLGAGNHGYLHSDKSQDEFRQAFTDVIVNHKVQVEFLWLNPQSPLALRRETEENRSLRYDAVEAMEWFHNFRESLPPAHRTQLGLLEYEATPSCGIVWADDRLIVTQYLPAEADVFAPGLILRKTESPPRRLRRLFHMAPGDDDPQIADMYMAAYREVRTRATSINATRLEELRAASKEFPHVRSESVLRSQAREQKT